MYSILDDWMDDLMHYLVRMLQDTSNIPQWYMINR